jgi:hypothetical protein
MDDAELVTVPIDEENESFVQDQLPSAEDIKTTIAASVAKFRITRTYLVPFFFVILTVIGLSIGLTQRNKSDGQNLSPQPLPTKNQPIQAPIPQHPTPFPTPLVSRLNDVIQFLDTNGISDLHDLSTDGTPQRKAVIFIADQDPLQLQISLTGGIIQRYAVVVIYYALHGRRWPTGLGWLTGESECKWQTRTISNNSSLVLGNVCNSAGEIVQLSLCKLRAFCVRNKD